MNLKQTNKDVQDSVKEQANTKEPDKWLSAKHPYRLNENYFIRTVTFHYTGKLLAVFDNELLLANAAWIPDDGRFADAMKTGNFNEIEPYPIEEPVIIGRGALVDAVVFNNPLPDTQK